MNDESVFLDALQVPADQQTQFVVDACGSDDAMRARILGLLAAHENPKSFLTRPADVVSAYADAEVASAVNPGDTIGVYTVREPLGEGGMGSVFVAEQEKPVRRKVALKIIKPGMDTKQVIARFGAERQALALMDHPNIAKVIDAGSTPEGRPFFVMELIRGIPITEYCDQAKMTTRARLELFTTVCAAVEHAHQKGIIHRDLKPSNVLITEIDGRPVAKVIDFGIAKATDGQASGQTVYSNFAQMIGTPLYMSPEQTSLSGVDVDTRSDVYSLGVMLYELISGTTPFAREELKQASHEEMCRVIREVDPPRPSARLSTLEMSDSSTISENRSVDPRKLKQTVQGELDWIAMKALDKDRSRRYGSATAIAADINRYLDDEPVEACPPSTSYRFRKFVRRNSGVLITASLVLVALCVGLGVAVWQAAVAIDERTQAEAAQDKAKQETAIATAVTEFLQEDLLGKIDPSETPDSEVKLRTILDRAASEIDGKFDDQPMVEAAIRESIGWAYLSLGKYKLAEPHLARAVELARENLGNDARQTLEYTSQMAVLIDKLGRPLESEKLLKQTHQSQIRVFGRDHKKTLWTQDRLAEMLLKRRRFAEAEELFYNSLNARRGQLGDTHIETLRSGENLAKSLAVQKKLVEAEQLARETLTKRSRTLGGEHPDTLQSIELLARVLELQAKHVESERLYEEKLEQVKSTLGEEHPSTVRLMNRLAQCYRGQRRHNEAEALCLKTLEISDRTLGREHSQTTAIMRDLAGMYVEQGRNAEAEDLLQETLEIYKRTGGEEHAMTLSIQALLAMLFENQGQYEKAESLCSVVLETRKRLLGNEHPQTLTAMDMFAVIQSRMGREDAAFELHKKIAEIRARVFGKESPTTQHSMKNIAACYADRRDYQKAANILEEVIEIYRRTTDIEDQDFIDAIGKSAAIKVLMGLYEEAEPLRLQAIELFTKTLGNEHPETLNQIRYLANGYRKMGRYKAAQELLEDVFDSQCRTIGVEHPDALDCANALANVYADRSQYRKAAELRYKCHTVARRVLGDKHSLTHMLTVNMANLSLKLACDPNAELRDPELALKLALQAVATEPESPYGSQSAGWAYYRLGRFQDAVDAFEKSNALFGKGGDPWQWVGQAMAHWQLGQPEAAHDYYGRSAAWLLRSKSEQVRQFMTEAETLMDLSESGRENAGIEHLSAQIDANPKDLEALKLRAAYFGRQEQWDLKAADLETIVDQRPDDFESLNNLSAICFRLRDVGRLSIHAQTMVRLRPDEKFSLVRMGQSFHLLKDYEKASAYFDRAVEIQETPWLHLSRTNCLAWLSRWDDALQAIRDSIRLQESSEIGYGWEALLLLQLKRTDEYQELRRRCVEKLLESPDAAPPLLDCIHMSTLGPVTLDEIDQMISLGSEEVKVDPENVELLRDMGALHYRQASFSKATTYLENAIELRENDALSWIWMAMCQYKSGDHNHANASLTRAIEIPKENLHFRSDRDSTLAIPLLLEQARALIGLPATTAE